MASTELGNSVLTGIVTPGATVAGAALSPSSALPFSESASLTSTVGNADSSDITSGTKLLPALPPFSSRTLPSDANDFGMTQLPATNASAISGASGGTTIVFFYKMSGMDHNVDGLYDTWVVLGAADYAGASYTGGLATPLRKIAISSAWSQ
jgi:hypothetical protein